MMIQPIARLNADNAAYNWMSAANAKMNLSFTGGNPASLLAADKSLTQNMLMDSFNYQCYSAMSESQDRINKENIKRTFSMFA